MLLLFTLWMFLCRWIYRDGAENMYYFSSLALTLNEPEEAVAPTDSRRRPDQRLMEEGRWDEANAEKQRLEEKQRSARREREREAVKAASSPEEGRNADILFCTLFFLHLCSHLMFLCPFIFCLSWYFLSAFSIVLTLSCHWGSDQWLSIEKQVLLLVCSHLWSELHTVQSKVHTQNVCAFSVEVLNSLCVILITACLHFTVPSCVSVPFSWCKRGWPWFEWDFWWKQVSFHSFM